MAPNTRTQRRQRDVASTLPVGTTAADTLLAGSNNPSNSRKSRNPDREPTGAIHLMETPERHDPDACDPDKRKLWTPEPEPYDPDIYAAWGRKHFGDDWYQQRKTMLQERNIYLGHDPVYNQRQRALRGMERERQEGKLPPKGKTWQELMAWARMHYGEVWYQHGEAIARLDKEEETSDPEEQRKIWSRQPPTWGHHDEHTTRYGREDAGRREDVARDSGIFLLIDASVMVLEVAVHS